MKSSQTIKMAMKVSGIVGWLYFLLIMFTFFNFISYLMFSGIIIFLPSIIFKWSQFKRSNWKDHVKKQIYITGFCIGLFAVILFPNLLRIPSQIHRRVDRANTLIAPEDPILISFQDDFISSQGGNESFFSLSLETQLLRLNNYIQSNIIWTEDIKTQLIVGDLSTPREAILSGKDDCRGQAVVTVSILLNMGYDAYVVEMPWHFYSTVYFNDTEYKINQYGHNNNTKQYPILMIWNDEGIKYIRDPISSFFVVMSSYHNFFDYYFDFAIILLLLIPIISFLFSVFSIASNYSVTIKSFREVARNKILKKIFIRIFSGFVILFLILFLVSFLPILQYFAWYIFIFGISIISTYGNNYAHKLK